MSSEPNGIFYSLWTLSFAKSRGVFTTSNQFSAEIDNDDQDEKPAKRPVDFLLVRETDRQTDGRTDRRMYTIFL